MDTRANLAMMMTTTRTRTVAEMATVLRVMEGAAVEAVVERGGGEGAGGPSLLRLRRRNCLTHAATGECFRRMHL